MVVLNDEMKVYSMDLRERIVSACQLGESQASVAKRFGVCSRAVSVYMSRAAQGQLAPRPIPGKAPRLLREQEEVFIAMVNEKSD